MKIGDLVKTINGHIGLVIDKLTSPGPHAFLVDLSPRVVHGRSVWGYKTADLEVISESR
jgi:hypothetical protein